MRTYHEIAANIKNHEDIFSDILAFIESCAVPRDINGAKDYFEGCFISQNVFTRLTSNAKKLSEKEFLWLPTPKISTFHMICCAEILPDGTYYRINLIVDGSNIIHFIDVTGTRYFFMDDGEKSTYLG